MTLRSPSIDLSNQIVGIARGSSAVLLLALAAACSGADNRGTTGALGQSDIIQECDSRDLACSPGLDVPIAVGASETLQLHITARGVTPDRIALVSTRPDKIYTQGTTIEAKAAGMSSILLSNADKTVLDFFTLTARTPTALRLHRNSTTSNAALPNKIDLLVGDRVVLLPHFYENGALLAGVAEQTWTLDGSGFSILNEGDIASRTIVGRSPGTGTVTVKSLGFEAKLTLQVLP
jgi:hypothetical protein